MFDRIEQTVGKGNPISHTQEVRPETARPLKFEEFGANPYLSDIPNQSQIEYTHTQSQQHQYVRPDSMTESHNLNLRGGAPHGSPPESRKVSNHSSSSESLQDLNETGAVASSKDSWSNVQQDSATGDEKHIEESSAAQASVMPSDQQNSERLEISADVRQQIQDLVKSLTPVEADLSTGSGTVSILKNQPTAPAKIDSSGCESKSGLEDNPLTQNQSNTQQVMKERSESPHAIETSQLAPDNPKDSIVMANVPEIGATASLSDTSQGNKLAMPAIPSPDEVRATAMGTETCRTTSSSGLGTESTAIGESAAELQSLSSWPVSRVSSTKKDNETENDNDGRADHRPELSLNLTERNINGSGGLTSDQLPETVRLAGSRSLSEGLNNSSEAMLNDTLSENSGRALETGISAAQSKDLLEDGDGLPATRESLRNEDQLPNYTQIEGTESNKDLTVLKLTSERTYSAPQTTDREAKGKYIVYQPDPARVKPMFYTDVWSQFSADPELLGPNTSRMLTEMAAMKWRLQSGYRMSSPQYPPEETFYLVPKLYSGLNHNTDHSLDLIVDLAGDVSPTGASRLQQLNLLNALKAWLLTNESTEASFQTYAKEFSYLCRHKDLPTNRIAALYPEDGLSLTNLRSAKRIFEQFLEERSIQERNEPAQAHPRAPPSSPTKHAEEKSNREAFTLEDFKSEWDKLPNDIDELQRIVAKQPSADANFAQRRRYHTACTAIKYLTMQETVNESFELQAFHKDTWEALKLSEAEVGGPKSCVGQKLSSTADQQESSMRRHSWLSRSQEELQEALRASVKDQQMDSFEEQMQRAIRMSLDGDTSKTAHNPMQSESGPHERSESLLGSDASEQAWERDSGKGPEGLDDLSEKTDNVLVSSGSLESGAETIVAASEQLTKRQDGNEIQNLEPAIVAREPSLENLAGETQKNNEALSSDAPEHAVQQAILEESNALPLDSNQMLGQDETQFVYEQSEQSHDESKSSATQEISRIAPLMKAEATQDIKEDSTQGMKEDDDPVKDLNTESHSVRTVQRIAIPKTPEIQPDESPITSHSNTGLSEGPVQNFDVSLISTRALLQQRTEQSHQKHRSEYMTSTSQADSSLSKPNSDLIQERSGSQRDMRWPTARETHESTATQTPKRHSRRNSSSTLKYLPESSSLGQRDSGHLRLKNNRLSEPGHDLLDVSQVRLGLSKEVSLPSAYTGWIQSM